MRRHMVHFTASADRLAKGSVVHLHARLGASGLNPSAPRDWRASFLDRGAALDHILAWPIERALIAHGDLPTEDGRAFVAALSRIITC